MCTLAIQGLPIEGESKKVKKGEERLMEVCTCLKKKKRLPGHSLINTMHWKNYKLEYSEKQRLRYFLKSRVTFGGKATGIIPASMYSLSGQGGGF